VERPRNLPADQAISLVGEGDLVVVGAISLALFLVLGVVAVVVAYAIDPPGRATTAMGAGLFALVAGGIVTALVLSEDQDPEGWREAAAVIVGLIGLAGMALVLKPRKADAQAPSNKLLTLLNGARPSEEKDSWLFKKRKTLPPTPRELREAAELKKLGGPDVKPPAKFTYRVRPLTPLVAGVVAFAFAVLFWETIDENFVGWSVIFASALGALCFAVARASGDRFWPYGVAVFFSVALFGALLSIVRLDESPQVNPVALVRSDNGVLTGVVGLLVARTDEDYWLGAVTLKCNKGKGVASDSAKEGSGRIFSVPRDRVVADELGASTDLADAGERAPALLRELVARQPAKTLIRGRRKVAQTADPSVPAVPAVEDPCTCARPVLDRFEPSKVAPGRVVAAHGNGLAGVNELTAAGKSLRPRARTATRLEFRASLPPGRYSVTAVSCKED
jgi:MFS family permease